MKDTIIFGFIASVFLIVVLLIPVSLVSAQKLISYIRH